MNRYHVKHLREGNEVVQVWIPNKFIRMFFKEDSTIEDILGQLLEIDRSASATYTVDYGYIITINEWKLA